MELAILPNQTNTAADLANIQVEYNAIVTELTAVLASKYKGASLFAASMSVGVDGRTTAKTYGVAAPTITGKPNSVRLHQTANLVTVQTNINTARTTLVPITLRYQPQQTT